MLECIKGNIDCILCYVVNIGYCVVNVGVMIVVIVGVVFISLGLGYWYLLISEIVFDCWMVDVMIGIYYKYFMIVVGIV